jgi:putative pyruvate formate lyase activating enzyme
MIKHYPELTQCRICPQNCGIDRYTRTGFCQATAELRINLHQLHFGEEPVISGDKGSGTIFFSHCNLRCVFCQNHTISHLGNGAITTPEDCIKMMLELQDKGAHNINLVTPMHYSLQLADILHNAKSRGLQIPVVWNSNAYENVETLKLLEGLVDIYLPDLKYASDSHSIKYSNASDYPNIAHKALLEMYRQVGNLTLDLEGIAQRGMIIRILVMPNNIAGVSDSLNWIKDNLGNETCISLMAQYYPTWKASNYDAINRGITQNEYNEALDALLSMGFDNGYTQDLSCSDEWTPDFIQG